MTVPSTFRVWHKQQSTQARPVISGEPIVINKLGNLPWHDAPAGTSGPFQTFLVSVGADDTRMAGAELQKVKQEIAELRELVAQLIQEMQPESVEIRDISVEQAKHEIKAYFNDHHDESIYPSDLEVALRLDYTLIVQLVGQLEEEGEIGKVQG